MQSSTMATVGINELREYCQIQDSIVVKRLALKNELTPLAERIATLREPLMKFIEESSEVYQFNGKAITVAKINKKQPLSAAFMKASIEGYLNETEADDLFKHIEEGREIVPTKAIARRAPRKSKKSKTDDEDEDEVEDTEEDLS